MSGIQLIKHIGCYGQETRLLECSHRLQSEGGGSNCEDVAVHCIPGKLSITHAQGYCPHPCVAGLVLLCSVSHVLDAQHC